MESAASPFRMERGMALVQPIKVTSDTFNTPSGKAKSKENSQYQQASSRAPSSAVQKASSSSKASVMMKNAEEDSAVEEPVPMWKSPTKVKYDSSTTPSMRSQIKALESKRAQLEEDGKYLDAENIHHQLIKLKVSEEARRRDSLKVSRQSHLKTLDEVYDDELQAVRAHYDRELREFEKRVEQGLAEMQERHEKQLLEYRVRAKASTEEVLHSKGQPSKKLLEMRRAEKALARQHEYRQANDLKLAADALEKQEAVERIERTRQSAAHGEEKLKEKLRNELAVFEQRNNGIRTTIVENRRIEENTVLLRYQNKKSDMLSGSSRVETIIEKRIEHISPNKPARRTLARPSSPAT